MRLSALMRKPFDPLTSKEGVTESVWLSMIRLSIYVLTVVAERILAVDKVGALVIALCDFAAVATTQSWLVATANLAGAAILALLPIWLSMPLSLIADSIFTGVVFNVYSLGERALNYVRNLLRDRFPRPADVRVEDFTLIEDEEDVLEEAKGPMIDIMAVPQDIPLPHVTMEGDPVTVEEILRLLPAHKPGAFYKLSANPFLDKFRKSDSLTAALTGLLMRYANVTKTNPKVYNTALEIVNILIDWSFVPQVIALTREEVLEHGRGRWSKAKLGLYDDAYEWLDIGQPYLRGAAPWGGKNDELLKLKPGDPGYIDTVPDNPLDDPSFIIKGRLVFYESPADHVGEENLIGWALAMKPAVIDFINAYQMKAEAYTVRMFVPRKGTPAELEWELQSMGPYEVLQETSGDDTRMNICDRYGNAKQLAADAESCDTTIQGPLQKPIMFFLGRFGLPPSVREALLKYNGMPKTCKLKDKGKTVAKLILDLKMIINCSGNAFTTLITIVALFLVLNSFAANWDGSHEGLKPCLTTSYTDLGLKVAYESPPDEDRNGLSPRGQATFLSTISFQTESGEIRVLPMCATKAMMIKNNSLAAKGMGLAYGLAARSAIPAFQTRPLFKAMAASMRRYALSKGFIHPEKVFDDMVAKDSSWEYKLQYDRYADSITVRDEMLLLEPFGVSEAMYQREMAAWNNTHEFPTKQVFPVSEIMANYHYNF